MRASGCHFYKARGASIHPWVIADPFLLERDSHSIRFVIQTVGLSC